MQILDDLNIKTNNIHLYETAFTHTSYTNETNEESYERLEYLGDAVLELIMTEYLYKKYPNMLEGEMTKTRAHYVCEQALYAYSIKLGLNNYLRLGHGEEENDGKHNQAIVADIFESFLGAMFLDQGLDKAKEYMYKDVIPLIESNTLDFFKDYKSSLQELMQSDKRNINYVLVDETGPAHKREFTMEVRIDDIVYGHGVGKSKKEAEQMAAKDALDRSCSK